MTNIYFIIFAIIFIIYIIYSIRRYNFSIQESFFWIVGCILMLLLSIFPKSIDFIAKKIGVSYPPSLLFILCILFLVYINFKNNKQISIHQEKITTLSQEIAILKGEINEKK